MVLSLDRFIGQVAVVTGAGGGIGSKTAEQLVKSGLIVVGLDINDNIVQLAQKLQHEKGKFYSIKTDLSKEEDILNAFKWIRDNLTPVHVLINCAGIIQENTLINGNTEKWRKVFNVNVLAVCITTREAIKNMQENNINGHIVHINSIQGHKVADIIDSNVYPASKHAVTALVETLRLELNRIGSQIKISSISPGIVATEIAKRNNVKRSQENLEERKTWPKLQPEDIADGVLYVLSTPKHVQVHELIIKPVNEKF